MIFEEFRGIKEAREIGASGPGADFEKLRSAYLDLLKLTLCDLAGSTTVSVGKADDGTVFSRELAGPELRMRAAGMDWPFQGLTMVGLNRLDDLQRCVESVVREQVPGDMIEAGAWRGGASILIRAALDSLGERRTVWVADSFQGFPVRDQKDTELSEVDYLAAPLDNVEESFARLGFDRGVRFIPGFFEHTLPGLRQNNWSLVRLDADTYEATWVALSSLYPGLAPGGYLIVDDYVVPECRRAVDEFRRRHHIEEPVQDVDWASARWRRESTAPIDVEPALVDSARNAPRAVPRPARAVVRSRRELELEQEVAELRQRLGTMRPRASLPAIGNSIVQRLTRRQR